MDLTEVAAPEDRSIGRQRLAEDLLAMGNEQEGELSVPVDQLAVIEGSDDRLARSGRCDNEVAMSIVTVPFDHQRFEHSLLVGVRTDLEIGEGDRRELAERSTVVLLQRSLEFVPVD